MLRLLLIVATVALLLYLVYALYFYANQRTILFPRHLIPVPTHVPTVPGMERMWLPTSMGEVEAWYLAPLPDHVPDDANAPAPLLIVAHGNGDLIDRWVSPVQGLRMQGFGVLLVEYPGYGRSQGVPTFAAIRETFLLAYDTMVRDPRVDPQRIILFGHSVGGGAVSTLAAERASAGMILMSTFTSVRAMAGDLRLPGFAVRDPFDTLAVVRDYPHPILIIHGRQDQTIPYHHGVALHAAAPDAELISLDCGHNGCIGDWERFWQELAPFFARAGIAR